MSGRYPNTSQHPTPAAQTIPMSLRSMEEYLEQSGEHFDQVVLEEVYELLPDANWTPQDSWADMPTDEGEELPTMEAARLIATELAAQLCLEPGCDQARTVDSRFCSHHTTERAIEQFTAPVQREIATPCETAEGTRLLREYRIATRHRADAAAKMREAASLYAYEAFGNARAERDYQDQTLSILRGKLRDLGITRLDGDTL